MISISANLNIMIKAVEKASKSIIRDFGEVEKLQVSKKGPRDFVTKTDRHVEKILIEELSNTKKNYSFITEETGTIKNKDKDNVWIIDPIDGTTNFLHGIPHFAISIALKSNNEIVSGLIFDPILYNSAAAALAPGGIKVNLENLNVGGPILSGDFTGTCFNGHANIQSFNITVPFERENLYGFESMHAYGRKMKYPQLGNISFEIPYNCLDVKRCVNMTVL